MKSSFVKHAVGYATVLAIAVAGTAQALPGTNTVASDDIINGQVRVKDLAGGAVTSPKVKDGTLTGADVKDGSLTGADIADGSIGAADAPAFYTKAQVDALLSGYVSRDDLGSYGRIKWGYVRDLGATVEVYVDSASIFSPDMSVVRTATGVYEVTVPGIQANGGYHGIWVSAEQGQTSVFRACKTFQTASTGTEPNVIVKVRCYDQTAALANTDFSILVLQ